MLEQRRTEREFFTLKELSVKIGQTYRTLHRAARDGRIKTIRFGGSVRVPRREVERLLVKGF